MKAAFIAGIKKVSKTHIMCTPSAPNECIIFTILAGHITIFKTVLDRSLPFRWFFLNIPTFIPCIFKHVYEPG